MIPIVIVGGLFALWRVLVNQQATIAANTPPPSTGITIGSRYSGGGPSELQTDSEIATGFQDAAKATSSIPVVGTIAGIASQIAGLFTGSHAAAVKKEAATMDVAAPQFIGTVDAIMASLNQGGINQTTAIAALKQAQSDYYSAVAGIIKGSQNCKIPCYGTPSNPTYPGIFPGCTESLKALSSAQGQCDVLNEDLGDCGVSEDKCNAACGFGCGIVQPTVTALTKVIQNGGGTFTIAKWQLSSGNAVNTPEITIVYKPFVTPVPESLGTILLHDIGF